MTIRNQNTSNRNQPHKQTHNKHKKQNQSQSPSTQKNGPQQMRRTGGRAIKIRPEDTQFSSSFSSRNAPWHQREGDFPYKADYSDYNVNPYRREAEMWHGGEMHHDSFEGMGPKGYRRSDDRIREDVCDQLASSPQIDASDIEVRVKDCNVSLSGTVNNRQTKRQAEMLIENIRGVEDVINEIRVKRDTETSAYY